MRPFLVAGDAVYVAPVDTSQLDVGTIVLCRTGWGRLAAHRIVRVPKKGCGKPGGISVRADATGPEELVETTCVLGKVIAFEREDKQYALDRGRYYWAGLVRVKSRLGGLILAAPSCVPRYLAARALPKLQGFQAYRRVAERLLHDRIRVRTAVPKDGPALAVIYGWDNVPLDSEHEARMTEELRRLAPDGCFVLADVGRKPAGAVVLRRFPLSDRLYPDWWLFSLIVRVRYRRAGVGERIVRIAVEEARRRGAAMVNVLVDHGNRAACELYRKLGFEPASIQALERKLHEEYSAGGRHQVVLSRSLS